MSVNLNQTNEGSVVFIHKCGEWTKIAMIPLAEVEAGQDRSVTQQCNPIWNNTPVIKTEEPGTWIAAFPCYPDSENDYPTITVPTRQGKPIQILFADINVSGNDVKIAGLPATNTLGFDFPTGDGFDITTLISFCAPQYLANTKYAGQGWFAQTSETSEEEIEPIETTDEEKQELLGKIAQLQSEVVETK